MGGGAFGGSRREQGARVALLVPLWRAAFGRLAQGLEIERSSKKLDEQRTEHTLVWNDPGSGLSVRCVVVEYHDFPTVEWTLYFKNTGSADTPILEDIQALDLRVSRGEKGEFILHHNVGSPCAPNDYQPLVTPLGPKATKRIAAAGGRPTNSDLSYFNLEWAGEGMIVVVGWPGQWAAQFTRDEARGLQLRAGQELTHFKLHPGEQVRTPLMVLQFWKGDWIRAQNIWRRWMLAHNVPRPGGRLPEPELFGCSSHYHAEMTQANEQNQIEWTERFLEEKDQDRPPVDGRRLVCEQDRLAQHRHLGGGYQSVSARPASYLGPRPRAWASRPSYGLNRSG